jgi:two-component system, OmpR family, phosphate regulon sensor histidine kinase PhoR
MKKKIIWKFWSAYIFLTLIAVLMLNFFVRLEVQSYYEKKISRELNSNAILVGDILLDAVTSNDKKAIFEKTKRISDELNLRITVINKEGKVLGDSEQEPELMENHMGRKEVSEALKSGMGESERVSATLGFNMKYLAVPIEKNGKVVGVIRVAMPLVEIEKEMSDLNKIFILGGFISIIVILVAGYFISKKITAPINQMSETAHSIAEGDLSKRVSISATDELGELAVALNKMADELQIKMNNLEKLDRVRTDFVANVSHELKTPLTSIKGFIETLEDGAIDDKENAAKFLKIISKHAEKLDNIINDLLDLTEIESLEGEPIMIQFDLNYLLDEVVDGFGPLVASKKQQLDVHYNGSDFKMNGDKGKIEQVLVNLIDNAIKYTPEEGKISASLFDQKKDLMFVLEDNGIGIQKEHLDRIFERFYRADKARSRELGGTGLGLSIVKHIVVAHKGHVDIDSEPDQGTTATVILPR